MAMSTAFVCTFCDLQFSNHFGLQKHIVSAHRCHPKFVVSCTACRKTWKNYESFRKHVIRKHSGDSLMAMVASNENDMDSSLACISDRPTPSEAVHTDNHAELAQLYEEQLCAQAAWFILKLESVHGLSQSAVSDTISYTNELVQTCMNVAKERMLHNVHESVHDEVEVAAKPVDAFQFIDTKWKHTKYLKDNFSLLEPVAVVMGERIHVNAATQAASPVKVYAYAVPFIRNLQHLLSMPEVKKCIFSDAGFDDRDNCMTDFKHGQYCKDDPVLRQAWSLKILGYYDDIEVVNPIGAHTKKHKLSVFFWTLLNIPPRHRSKLSCIQLVAVAKSRDCKQFGVSALLSDFTHGLKLLYEEGIDVLDESGAVLHLKGGLVAFCGDTLASNVIGGFKEGVGFAHKVCRTCEISKTEMKSVLLEDQSMLRDEIEHIRRCQDLSVFMTSETRQYWSHLYGINGSSVLINLPGFSLTSCLIHDPMHLLFEGVSVAEIKNLLKYLIYERKYFTLSFLNVAMTEIALSIPANCRPNQMDADRLRSVDSKLNLTANQMMWYAHLLPFAVSYKIPEDDEKWINFIRLLQIQQLSTSPVATAATVFSLELLIARHNKIFQDIYPLSSFTPKMHYLVHLPSQIKKFGPLRNHWCMRMEAKNSFFKRKKLKNTKNVPLTVARDHQLWMCYSQHDSAGSVNQLYLRSPLSHSTGHPVALLDYAYGRLLLETFQLSDVQLVVVNEVIINDVKYRTDDVILSRDKCCGNNAEFCIVKEIAVCNSDAYLLCTCSNTEYFDCHKNAYYIRKTHVMQAIHPEMLQVPWPVFSLPGMSSDEYYVSSLSCSDIEIIV